LKQALQTELCEQETLNIRGCYFPLKCGSSFICLR